MKVPKVINQHNQRITVPTVFSESIFPDALNAYTKWSPGPDIFNQTPSLLTITCRGVPLLSNIPCTTQKMHAAKFYRNSAVRFAS